VCFCIVTCCFVGAINVLTNMLNKLWPMFLFNVLKCFKIICSVFLIFVTFFTSVRWTIKDDNIVIVANFILLEV